MKKYLYIYKSTLIENLSYIPNIMLGFITFFITMFVLINLWQYIYSDPNEVINGYTIEQMMWYVLITETLWYGTKNKILTNEISQDIRTGKYHCPKSPHYYTSLVTSTPPHSITE